MSFPPAHGAFVISLDFELMWGVLDRADRADGYMPNLLGARTVIPRMLELFEEYSVHATWGTVGFLFARNVEERAAVLPPLRPAYHRAELNAYREPVGQDEDEDPVHYAGSLIDRIAATRGQEIGSHTFSHYYCWEDGQNAETFAADMKAAVEIARRRGFEIRSIVFPRNQHQPAYDETLLRYGITAYRGNPKSWMWRFGNRAESRHPGKRLSRLADAYLPLRGKPSLAWDCVLEPSGLSNIAASLVLRPTGRFGSLDGIRIARINHEVERAARAGRIFHMWWHPHNFGIQQDQNLLVLRNILEGLRRCREQYGMMSLTMAEVDTIVRGHVPLRANGSALQPAGAQELNASV